MKQSLLFRRIILVILATEFNTWFIKLIMSTELTPQSTLGSRWWSQSTLVWPLAMSCLDAKISLVPKFHSTSNLIGPSPFKKHTNRKDTKIHMLRPLTYELFFYFLVEHCSTNAGGGLGFKLCWSPEFFYHWGGGGGAGRLFAIGYISLTTALIISSFKICISTFHIIFIPLLLLNDVIMMSNYIINNN